MYIGVGRLSLVAPGSRSLKDKRAIIRRIKDRVGNKFTVAIAEVDAQDTWQRIVLGVAAVSGSAEHAADIVAQVARFVASLGVANVVADDRDVIQFGGELGLDDAVGWNAAKFDLGDDS